MSRSVFSEPYEALLRALIIGRQTAGLRQVDLANRLGKPQSFVSKYETGERRLDIVELLVIARSIGLDPHALVDRSPPNISSDTRI